MTYANRVKESTTSTSTSAITLGGTSVGYRAVASAFSVGDTGVEFLIGPDSAGAWLLGEYTVGSGSLTRTAILDSSAAGADVTLAAGVKDVFATIAASTLTRMMTSRDIAFSAAVPLSSLGTVYMPQQTVAGAITFTVAGTPVRNAYAYVRLLSNGVNTPTFNGMLERGGSAGYDNRPGIVNIIEFFNDGYDTWYAISQAVNAVAVDTIAPTALSAVVDNATPTLIVIAMSEVLDSANNPPIGAFTIAGHPITAATITSATIRLITSTAVTGGESLSVSYAPTGTNNVKDPSNNAAAGFTIGITNNIAAAATAVTMTGPTSGASGTASTNFTLGVSPVGGTISGTLTVTPSDSGAGGTFTPTSRALTTASPTGTFTYTPSSAGAKAISVTNSGGLANPASITYTASASATAPAAPTIGTAVAGAGYVDVAFTPGSDGGSAFLDHTATLSTGETAVGTTSPIRVPTSTTTARTANVKSRNAIGTGPASAESNSVSPTAAPDYPRFTSKTTNLGESGSGPWSITGINAGDYTNQQACVNKMFGAAGVDGVIAVRFEQVAGNGFTFGLSSSSTYVAFASMAGINLVISGGVYSVSATGSPTNHGANMAPAEGDILRIRRTGVSVIMEVARAATPTTFVPIGTWASGINTTVNKYFNIVVASDAKFTPLDGTGLVAVA